jgi:NADPH-dependent 2,4-dienoyl-CoA reductase/sulfur reductase-like enzyme/nitrite reductase/ring-hydroxylating ferredoxin subunit
MEERVAGTGDLSDGQMTTVLVGGKKVLLAKVDGRFYATAARCPHWGGPLPEGTLHGSRLLCPWHKATFDVCSGDLLDPPALDGIAAFRVRVDGDDVYVDRSEEPRRGRTMPMYACDIAADKRLFAIIGGGAAAAAAAEALRQECYIGRIMVISDEDRWPYDRPNLSKDFLAGELEAKWLPLRSPEFYEEHVIERVVGRVTRLDVADRVVTLDDGTTFTPDAVLIATGARPRRLDVPGASLPGVFTLRSWADGEALAAAAAKVKRAVVVGASFIGMEAAASLVRRGLDVTVVVRKGTPFAAALGESVGGVVQACHEEKGTRFALNRGIARLVGTASVQAVELDNGETLDADLVVVGVGVEPVTDFVKGVELDRDGGLAVDAQLRVAPGVWAAGDVARYRDPYAGQDVRIEHWRLAEQHGRAAARAMAGRGEPFAGVPFFWTKHFDLELGYAGAGRGWDDVVVTGDLEARDFTAFYAAGDRLLAACGTQGQELGAFMELMRLGKLPAAGELRGRKHSGLAALLAKQAGDTG